MALYKKVVVVGWVFIEHEHASTRRLGCRNDFVDATSAIVGPERVHMNVRSMFLKRPASWNGSPFFFKGFHGAMHRFELFQLKFSESVRPYLVREQDGHQQA